MLITRNNIEYIEVPTMLYPIIKGLKIPHFHKKVAKSDNTFIGNKKRVSFQKKLYINSNFKTKLKSCETN